MKTFKKRTAAWIIIVFFLGGVIPPEISGITIKEEEELSRQMLTAIYQYYEIIDDPAIESYVNEVGRRILATLPDQPFTYHFHGSLSH